MVVPAAQYLRMSTEHQQYSLDNQSAAIRQYADDHGFVIIQTYQDVAKSGLMLRKRPGLAALLNEVISQQARFRAILVLDVTRWGRFQDVDESAHYEFLCKKAGVPVYYCSENFTHEANLVNAIVKGLKRSMAAEYSRELSVKVAMGSRRIAALGFRNGGIPGYGFRRQLVSRDKSPKQLLGPGERKNLATDRVILVPGPPNEVQCIREIFRMFIEERRSARQIALELNRLRIPYLKGREWYQQGVYRLLTNPKCCGCHVFGRRSQILQGPNITMPRTSWCMVPGAFEPVISPERFEEAQKIVHSRTFFKSNDRVLDALRALLTEKGKLTQTLISKAKGVPSTGTFWWRFGGLRNAYKLIGYSGAQSSPQITATRRRLAFIRLALHRDIVQAFPKEVRIARKSWRHRLRLRLKDRSLVTVYLCRCGHVHDGSLRWYLNTPSKELCKLALIVRLNEGNDGFHDFCLFSGLPSETRLTLKSDDPRLSGGARFTEISQFMGAVRSVHRPR